MMTKMTINLDQLKTLRKGIRDVCALEHVSNGFADLFLPTVFPPSQLHAADFEIALVEGYCGAGKSHLCSFIASQKYKNYVKAMQQGPNPRELETSRGFAQDLSIAEAPDRHTLYTLLRKYEADQSFSTVAIWRAVLAHGLRVDDGAFSQFATWEQRVDWVHTSPQEFENYLAAADVELDAGDRMHLALFDALDQMADNWADTLKLLGGLLQLAREMRAKRVIRCKLFLRPDMMAMVADDFRDGAKLWPYKKTLHWRRCDLYALFFRLLASHPAAGPLFRDIGISLGLHWIENVPIPEFVVNPALFKDEKLQALVFHRLTGNKMGEISPYAPPYVWLINALQDSLGFVSPTSFMAALGTAAQEVDETAPHALDWRAIFVGVHAASYARVTEICTAHPWVKLVMSPLLGKLRLPVPLHQIEDIWRAHQTLETLTADLLNSNVAVKLPPRKLEQGAAGIIEELSHLGVLQTLLSGEIQMNDVYRRTFGFGRKGGINVANNVGN
jgi:hypothetical protein